MRCATTVALAACLVATAARSSAQVAGGPARASTTAADSALPRGVSADTALEALTRRVAAQLRCPVCQGLSLADSPSELALGMKDVVRGQLAAGRSPDEVKAYFVAKYGEWILLEPERRGVNWLAYLLPAFAVVAGLGVVWLALRRWTSGPAPADEPSLYDAVD